LHDQNFVDNSLASFIPTNGCLYFIKDINKSVDLINTCPIDCLLFNFFILNKKFAEIQNYFRLYNNIKSIKVLNSCFDLISANNWAKCQYEWSRFINLIGDATFVNSSEGDCIEVNVWGNQMERFVEYFSELQRGSYLTRCENKHCTSKIKYCSIKSFCIDSKNDNYPIETKRIKCRACNHYRKFDRFNFLQEPVFLMVEASSRDKILDFNTLKKNIIINGESFQLMASTNFTSSKLSSNKNDHFTGIVKLNDDYVCFDNLSRIKEFFCINNLNASQYSHFANNIGVSIYVRFGSSLKFEKPEIRPFDRSSDIPLNFLLLEKISNVQLNEYLSQFEKSLNGILNKELFSWRFKVYCMNKVKERNILIARSHTQALSSSQSTIVADYFHKIIKMKDINVNIIPLVLLPEFIIFLGMNILDSDFDDIDNKLSNFFFTRKKNNPVNILDYYVTENKEDSETDNEANEEFIFV
jgi:hypothetical protein